MLSLFRRLARLRREYPALAVGSCRLLETGDTTVISYLREHEDGRLLVALNFGEDEERRDGEAPVLDGPRAPGHRRV